MKTVDEQMERRLRAEHNIWVATARPDGRPHLTPTWFVWQAGKVYLCIDPASVKARNLAHNDRIALALENGATPLIIEGIGRQVDEVEWPQAVIAEFKRKYDWDITADEQYRCLVETKPSKILSW
ncbi:MAG TPA: pyridoxamine 5'-phosphate oxidase family protein [Anaerolineae bacterium]|nr:pyridoxamine 5'-phosphate oxidase family protein [Anaerolineae bacterium]